MTTNAPKPPDAIQRAQAHAEREAERAALRDARIAAANANKPPPGGGGEGVARRERAQARLKARTDRVQAKAAARFAGASGMALYSAARRMVGGALPPAVEQARAAYIAEIRAIEKERSEHRRVDPKNPRARAKPDFKRRQDLARARLDAAIRAHIAPGA